MKNEKEQHFQINPERKGLETLTAKGLGDLMIKDFERAVEFVIKDGRTDGLLESIITAAAHLSGVSYKTAKYEYMPKLTSLYGPFAITKDDHFPNMQFLELRKEARYGR